MFCVDINVSIITPLFFSSLSFSFYHNSSKRPHNQAVDSGSPEALHGTASTSAPLDQNSWKNEQQEFAEGSDNKHWATFPGPAPKGSYRWGHVKSLQAHLDFVLLINKLFKFSKSIRPLVYNHAFFNFFFFVILRFWRRTEIKFASTSLWCCVVGVSLTAVGTRYFLEDIYYFSLLIWAFTLQNVYLFYMTNICFCGWH